MFETFDFQDFWEDSDYARREYVEEPFTPAIVRAVEDELGFRLPESYLAFMSHQNGGIPKRNCCPSETRTSWADDHIAVNGFLGIGREKASSLLGSCGSQFMQKEWGYPGFGIYICDCPSARHDMVMLDYRESGPEGEPTVVHVDQEYDYQVTVLAPNFESFVGRLVPESEYDTSEEDLQKDLAKIQRGSLSTALAGLLMASSEPEKTERSLRQLLYALTSEKGYLALHDDPKSHLVYDLLFDLFTSLRKVKSSDEFLIVYPDLIAFGDGGLSSGGYSPDRISGWINNRICAGDIIERDGDLVFSDAYRQKVWAKLSFLVD